jgi:hypothetical protein
VTSPDSTATAKPGAGPYGGPIDATTADALSRLGLTEPGVPQLAAMVAALLGQDEVEVLGIRVDEHPYAFFVKVVQPWASSPLSHHVPEPLRTEVAPLVPWRTEPDLYRSDLRDRLPAGLTVPRAFGVHDDPDDDSTAIWLELVTGRPVPWDLDRHRRAAYGSSPNSSLTTGAVGGVPGRSCSYSGGRAAISCGRSSVIVRQRMSRLTSK